MGEYKQDVPIVHETPRRLHPIEHGAMATVSSALAAMLFALLIERPLDELWRWLVAGALLPLIVFLLSNLLPLIAWTLEGIAHHDFTGDGVVGRPQPILVNPAQGQAAARQQSEAQYRTAINRFVRGCTTESDDPAGLNTMERWRRQGMSRGKYEAYRDTLLGAGHAVWNGENHQQGWRLLKPTEQVIEELWRL
jgi:hypothetical protein